MRDPVLFSLSCRSTVYSLSSPSEMLTHNSLGAGLDKITSGFRLIVGNSGLGSDGIPIFISAAVIFIGFFSLYFGTPGSTRKSGRGRTLAWFFSHFFFLAALIVALQGHCLLVFAPNIMLIWSPNCLLSGIATSIAFSVRLSTQILWQQFLI